MPLNKEIKTNQQIFGNTETDLSKEDPDLFGQSGIFSLLIIQF